jgi:hypothetical protein
MAAWFESQVQCPSCKQETKPGNFCGHCGGALPGTKTRCGNCGANVLAAARFCGECGQAMSAPASEGARETARPQMTGNRWARRPEDFATRVEVADVDGFFSKGLIVEAGTKALFFTNGAYSGLVEAGKHEIGGLKSRIMNVFSSKTTTALLLDAGDVELKFALDGIRTRDPLSLSADAVVVLRLEDPVPFFENLLKGRQNYSLGELRQFMAAELQNAAQELVGNRSATELSTDLSVKQALEQALASHLARTLERKGLTLIQVRVVAFRHARFDALNNVREEYWLNGQELNARLAGGDLVAGVERKVLDQETARALMQVHVFEQRAQVFERMRRAVNSEEMGKVRTGEELAAFLHQVDKDRLIRDEELVSLRSDFDERKQDRDAARQHLVRSLEISHGIELDRLKLVGKLSLQSTVAQAMRSEELSQFDVGLEKRRRETALRVEEQRLQHEQQIAETGSAMDILDRMKRIKAEEADRDLERELRGERDRHTRDLERITKLAELGPDAMLSFAPADRAALMADLRKTELLKGMTEDQILAMQAGGSAAIAEALKVRFASTEGKQALERLVQEKEKHYDQTVQLMREQSGQMTRFAERALDTMRDTAVATTRAGQPGMTVITPGMGAGVVHTGAGAATGRPTHCPKCHREVAGQNFCENCGFKFFE